VLRHGIVPLWTAQPAAWCLWGVFVRFSDGMVARALRVSCLGKELDSLADVVISGGSGVMLYSMLRICVNHCPVDLLYLIAGGGRADTPGRATDLPGAFPAFVLSMFRLTDWLVQSDVRQKSYFIGLVPRLYAVCIRFDAGCV
jgi:phosphatidylserine synthase